MAFTIKLDTASLERAISVLGQRSGRAIARAINRGATTARAVMARDIAADLGLKVNVVRDQLVVRDARPDDLKASISVSGRPIPLIHFKARQTRQGVTARIPGLKRYEGAFIATVRTRGAVEGQLFHQGHKGVFKRVPGKGRRRYVDGRLTKNRSQLPIYQLHGPSLPKVFAKLAPNALSAGEESLMKNLGHELEYAITQIAQ